MNLREVVVEPVAAADESRCQRLMRAHHYPGALPKIGETQWYMARWRRDTRAFQRENKLAVNISATRLSTRD